MGERPYQGDTRRCRPCDRVTKIVVTIGDCSHADSVVHDAVVDTTDGYRSQGARLHILVSLDLWGKPKGRGSLMSWGAHVLREAIRSTLQGETLNIQGSAEGGDLLRAAIAHTDNQLPPKKSTSGGKKLTTHDWESKVTASMWHIWLTDCDSTASSLHNTATPAGQDKWLNTEIKGLRGTLWRTDDGDRIDPRVTDKRPEKTSDRCLWIDTAVMLADPWTKTNVSNDITDRLTRPLEDKSMDFTQADFMKNKKERSRDQAKGRKEFKNPFLLKSDYRKGCTYVHRWLRGIQLRGF